MKKFIQNFFTTLGVVFFLLIIVGIYLFITDPLEIRPLIGLLTQQTSEAPTGSPSQDANPLLNAEQEQLLRQIGVNPAALPTEITPAMAACFYEKLGKVRAEEIEAGAAPNAADFFKARGCLE
jgi:hypothetical protein